MTTADHAGRTHKIVFIGEPGAGKTTCIAALSQIAPLTTDVGCTGELARIKETTTVALDYGELELGNEGRLLLYGLPGQSRFSFMFDVVREGLLGIVVLVDALAPDGAAGFAETLEVYAKEIRRLPTVVVLNKNPQPAESLMQRCQALLRRHDIVAPILTIDARTRAHVVRVCEVLFALLEFGTFASANKEPSRWR
jgi:uncharacterized protein